jgi:uncharacterized protein (DUF1800 family)
MSGIAQLFEAPMALLPQLAKQIKNDYDVNKDKLVAKYANHSYPFENPRKVRSGIGAYVGPWTQTEAKHLLKRTMFGVKPGDLSAVTGMTMSQAVDALINAVPNAFPLPLNYYQNTYADPTGVAYGQSWITADYGDGTVDYYRQMGLKADWFRTMVNQNVSVFEQMVMFWYNLLPVQSSTQYAKFSYHYLMLIRQYAMGNFKDFIKAISKQDAMLLFLNGFLNNKYSPDENYARELQELFTVGKDGGQQFTEDDVKEAARVLTGWRIDFTNFTSFYDENLHDTTNKTFSAFYNNTVIAGQTGPTGGDAELDALVDMIFSGNSATITAKHICRKIYSHFVYYNIDASVEANVIAPLAQTFITSGWDISAVLSQLLKSEHFYDANNMGCLIKSPMQIMVGTIRTLDTPANTSWTFEQVYWNWLRQIYYGTNMGQELLEVPSVSGWKPYYQMPMMHELWINSDTFPKRLRYTDQLVTNYGFYVDGVVNWRQNLHNFIGSLNNPSNPDAVIDQLCELFYGLDVSNTIKTELKANLLNNQTANSYWTTAWNTYVANTSDQTAFDVVRNRVKNLLTKFCQRAEFQLC